MSSSGPETSSKFAKAFEKHRTLLNEHLELWRKASQELNSDDATHQLVAKCLDNTQHMIKSCAELTSILSKSEQTNATQRKRSVDSTSEEKRGESPKRHKPNGTLPIRTPVTDPSGLFAIDPTPSNVDTLLDNAQDVPVSHSAKKKRQRTEAAPVQQDDEEIMVLGIETPVKRQKVAHAPKPAPPPKTSQARKPRSKKVNKTSQQDEEADADAAYQREFEAKVELRLKEKDDQRKMKANKKRKRESNGSNAPTNGNIDGGHSDGLTKRQRKKARKAEKSVNSTAADNSTEK